MSSADLTTALDFAELQARALARVHLQLHHAVKQAKQDITLDFYAAQVANQRAYDRLDDMRRVRFGV